MRINELTKSQMANYLYVRDIIKAEADIDNNFSVISMMDYFLPYILIFILILIFLLYIRLNGNILFKNI